MLAAHRLTVVAITVAPPASVPALLDAKTVSRQASSRRKLGAEESGHLFARLSPVACLHA